MIIVPEIETVVILVPRTGSGSLYKALQAKYPRSMLIYRHMEADGVPDGYNRWRKVGVVREPVDRLWSLYRFLRDHFQATDPTNGQPYLPRLQATRKSVAMPFSEWVVSNREIIFDAHDLLQGKHWPVLTTRHTMPENVKSQFIYLRPDLGTEVWRFEDKHRLAKSLGVELMHRHNSTDRSAVPPLSAQAADHMHTHFRWDFQVTRPPLPLELAS